MIRKLTSFLSALVFVAAAILPSLTEAASPAYPSPIFQNLTVNGTLTLSAALGVAYGGTNCTAASGTCLDNIAGFATNGIIERTGAGTYSIGTLGAKLDAMLGSPAVGSIIYKSGANAYTAIVCPSSTFLAGNGSGSAPTCQTPAAATAPPRSSKRQVVQGGPVTSSGAPNFLPLSSSNSVLASQNISSTNPLTVSAAQGSNSTGPNDQVIQILANLTWSGFTMAQNVSSVSCTTSACTFTTSAAHNLAAGMAIVIAGCSQAAVNTLTPYIGAATPVASVGSTTAFTIAGAFTAGSPTGCIYTVINTLLINGLTGAASVSPYIWQPYYANTSATQAPVTQANVFSFDISQMVGYLGNGTSAVATPLVAVGELQAATSALGNVVPFAYNGHCDTGWVSSLPSTGAQITFACAPGFDTLIGSVWLKNIGTAVANATNPGEVTQSLTDTAGNIVPFVIWGSRATAGFTTGSSAAFEVFNKSTGGFAVPAGSWAYRGSFDRPW